MTPDDRQQIEGVLHKIPALQKYLTSEEAASLRVILDGAHQTGRTAACDTGEAHREESLALIHSFRSWEINFLCNVDVLTTGFDAPKVDVVCVTIPTTSSVLYEQMVGHGLRGPQNGRTESCLVIDVQNNGLPADVMSYARVQDDWDA